MENLPQLANKIDCVRRVKPHSLIRTLWIRLKSENTTGLKGDPFLNYYSPVALLFSNEANPKYSVALVSSRRLPVHCTSNLPPKDPLSPLAMASDHGSVVHLLPHTYKRIVSAWLEEDCPSFDYGGFVVGGSMAKAKLFGKSAGMVAGVPFFDEVFRQLDCTYDLLALISPGSCFLSSSLQVLATKPTMSV